MKTIWIEDDQHKKIKLEAVNNDKQMSEIFTNMFDNYFITDENEQEEISPE